MPRLALAGLGLALLSGCSSDVTRFSASPSPFSGNPFSNPFASKTADASPTPAVTAAPLAQGAPAAAAAQTASAARKPQAVGGSAVGWTAAGGSPVVVADGETLDSLSSRYGVPAAALLSANGLSNGAEVKSGMRIVVPVYHADGHGVASAETAKARKGAKDVADADTAKAKKEKEKSKDLAKAEKPAEGEKPASKNDAVALAEPAKPAETKTPTIDKAPTGNLETGASAGKVPLTAPRPTPRASSPNSAGRRAAGSFRGSRPAATTASTSQCRPGPQSARRRPAWSSTWATGSRVTATSCSSSTPTASSPLRQQRRLDVKRGERVNAAR